MRLSSQHNQFVMNLNQDFIEPWLNEQFMILMEKDFIPYSSPIDYISSTIKEIVFPSLSFDVAEQRLRFGKKVAWKETGSVFDKFTNELDITFRSVDSHLNYFMLMQILLEYYENTEKHQIPMIYFDILDKDGDIIYSVVFREVFLKSISEKRLAYNRQDLAEETFTVTFRYNFPQVDWRLSLEDKSYQKSVFDIPINFKPGKLDRNNYKTPFDIRPKV